MIGAPKPQVSASAFPAIASNPQASKLLSACADAYEWGALHKDEDQLETKYVAPAGITDPAQVSLLQQCVLAAQSAELAGRSVYNLSEAQLNQYADEIGFVVASGLEAGLSGTSMRSPYTPKGTWGDAQKSMIDAMYKAAWGVYGSGGSAYGGEAGAEGEAAKSSGMGTALAITAGLAVAVGGALLLMSGNKAAQNPYAMNPRGRLNDQERSLWIDNDEGLYSWWKSSRQSKRDFIRENKAEIDAAIIAVRDAPPRPRQWWENPSCAMNPGHGEDLDPSQEELFDALLPIAENDGEAYRARDAKMAVANAWRDWKSETDANLREDFKAIQGKLESALKARWARERRESMR